MGLAMSGMFYQVNDGEDAESLNVTIDTVDQAREKYLVRLIILKHLRKWSEE